jgi:hypothetical protein
MRRRASLAVFAALAGVGAGERRGLAAVQVESSLQESVFDQDLLESPNLTVGTSPQRLLVVTVATGNLSAAIETVSWNGARLSRFASRALTAPAGPCLLELWTLLDPAPGTGPLQVSLSTSAGFGLGAVVYAGVDREAPFGPQFWRTGSGGRLSMDLPVPGTRPVLGAACMGGAWTTGPTLTTPEAEPGAGEDELWNFTEPRVVGLGSHRMAMGGTARISWGVTGSEPYSWLAVGLSIKPAGEVLPDAGPDGAADGGAGDDGGVGDVAPDRGMGPDRMVRPPEEADADEIDASVASVHLRVGCACDTGSRCRGDTALLLLVLGLIVAGRRRRRA